MGSPSIVARGWAPFAQASLWLLEPFHASLSGGPCCRQAWRQVVGKWQGPPLIGRAFLESAGFEGGAALFFPLIIRSSLANVTLSRDKFMVKLG